MSQGAGQKGAPMLRRCRRRWRPPTHTASCRAVSVNRLTAHTQQQRTRLCGPRRAALLLGPQALEAPPPCRAPGPRHKRLAAGVLRGRLLLVSCQGRQAGRSPAAGEHERHFRVWVRLGRCRLLLQLVQCWPDAANRCSSPHSAAPPTPHRLALHEERRCPAFGSSPVVAPPACHLISFRAAGAPVRACRKSARGWLVSGRSGTDGRHPRSPALWRGAQKFSCACSPTALPSP